MGLYSNIKNWVSFGKSDTIVVKASEYEEAKKGLEDLKTLANYSRPQDLSGLTPNLSLSDATNLISPVDLYQIARFSDILRNVIPTIRNEIFRNGFDVQAADIEVSTRQDEKIWALIDRANHNEQTLKEVLMEFEDDLQIYDNGYLLALKTYFINEDLDIIGGEIDELIRVDPLITEKVLDRKARMGYDLQGRQMYFSLKNRSEILYNERDSEGRQNLRACFKVKTGDKDGDVVYYDSNEMLHVSKYNPSKTYGFSQLYSLYNKVMTLITQDTYIRNYYSGSKVPKGLLVANTSNASSFSAMWNQFLERTRLNPHTVNPIINQSSDPSKNTIQFISFMNNLQEMQYTEGRNEMRQVIGSLFYVSPVFQNDVSTGGGLNNEGLQITVTNRGVEIGQSIYNEKVLNWIFKKNMGITDYTVRLKPSDEIDEASEKDLRLKELQIAKATAELGLKVSMQKDGTFSYEAGEVVIQQPQTVSSFGDVQQSDLKKSKVHLNPGESAPKGAKIIEGPRGGKYYESSGKEPSNEKISDNQTKENAQPYDNDKKFKERPGDEFLDEEHLEDVLASKKIDDFSFQNLIVTMKGKKYKMVAEEWFPDCMESRGLGKTNEKSVKEDYKQIMEKETGLKPDITGWVKNDSVPFGVTYIMEEIKKADDTKKADKLPLKEQQRFQTALEKELDEIVSKLDFSKKPSKAELDRLVEKITKNLNKRLNAKSANFIKAIYDKAKSLVEKEIDMKFDMTERDRNVIEALKRDPIYRKSFDGVSLAMSKNLSEIISRAYEDPKNFTIDKIVKDMKQELDASSSSLRKIARTETSKVSIAARKVQYDKSGFQYKYRVIGPNDNRTGKDSKEIVEATKGGVSWDEMVNIIQKVADKYSKGKWRVDKNAPIPRPNWRHVPVGERIKA